ncbi:MAG: response regulator [Nannocystaceae bacterium]|nr:response regulator [bacterium]
MTAPRHYGPRHSSTARAPQGRARWSSADSERVLEAATSRVLLAEDDSDMRKLLSGALRRQGYDVIELSNGTDVLSYLGSSTLRPGQFAPPDLVISDVRMPGASGLSILVELRRAGWELPFILCTAFGDDALHSQAAKLGVRVFDKPFDIPHLVQYAASVQSPMGA